MNISEINDIARRLYQAHGDRAEFEAAQKARQLAEVGNSAEASDWRRIREAIAERRGAPYS